MQSSTQYALGLSSMLQPFKDSNPENTLKNTCQPISGLHPVSGGCETLISAREILLISLTVNQIHTPHPLHLAPRIHPTIEKQLLSILPFGCDKEKWKRSFRKQVLHCGTYNENYQQAAGVGAERAADINASLTPAVPPQWGDPGVAFSASLEKGHRKYCGHPRILPCILTFSVGLGNPSRKLQLSSAPHARFAE